MPYYYIKHTNTNHNDAMVGINFWNATTLKHFQNAKNVVMTLFRYFSTNCKKCNLVEVYAYIYIYIYYIIYIYIIYIMCV